MKSTSVYSKGNCSVETETTQEAAFIVKSDTKECHSLDSKLILRENLLLMNEKNENTTRSLLAFKKELETYRAELQKTLFFLNVNIDKQKLLSKKKLKDYADKKQKLQEQYKRLPFVSELEDLINNNMKLTEEYTTLSDLIEKTKLEYNKLAMKIENDFRMEVFKLCKLYRRRKTCESVEY